MIWRIFFTFYRKARGMYWILIQSSPKKIPSWPPSIPKSYALSNRQSLQVSLSTIQIMENWVPVNKKNRPSKLNYICMWGTRQILFTSWVIFNHFELKKQNKKTWANQKSGKYYTYVHTKWKKTSLRQTHIAPPIGPKKLNYSPSIDSSIYSHPASAHSKLEIWFPASYISDIVSDLVVFLIRASLDSSMDITTKKVAWFKTQ